MTDKLISNYKNAGLFVIISGILHLPLFLFSGYSPRVVQMAIVGVVWILLGLGLRRQMKYLPCVVYFLMLFGCIAILTDLNTGFMPNIWVWLIFLADLIAAFFLFRIIWSKRKTA